MTDLTSLLDEIAAAGWLVNNLFQHDTGEWQANLRSPTHLTQFGLGPTPTAALDAALDAMTFARAPAPPVTYHLGAAPAPRPSLTDLLKDYQPAKPAITTTTTPLIRRF